ncbi:histone acetyltransferase-like protein [Lophiotrema nucula]|uniref:Histone acetyltransferase-like protein n=1 Tax=Lophiotrema nucula TaxID=690887 RepID=A0A6A5YW80_9PLEO|nr:histone acetyltransferase-like protein [Lophiotrema nucula]
MPAMLDDPTSPPIRRPAYKSPLLTYDELLQADIRPRSVTLKDGTKATIIPFTSPSQVPQSLSAILCAELNKEIEKGDTYPMVDQLPLAAFHPYWFSLFGAIMFSGEFESAEQITKLGNDADWEKICLGSFYVKPNYPGRSSHVCNGGFLVTPAARNRGVGKLLGQAYLEWAPKLGYKYSVFNLVYETNVPSLRIWDSLGFERVGRIKGCGNLGSYPDKLVDAIIYGYDFSKNS